MWQDSTDFEGEENVKELVNDVFRLYTEESSIEVLRILRARYSPGATFLDPLVAARPRPSVELQFYALHRIFTNVEVEVEGEPRMKPLKGKQAGLWQVEVDNTQILSFSRTSRISQQVLPREVELQATTVLTVDPRQGQVLRHEDIWHSASGFRLPLLWRRLNARWMGTVFRMLGWGRELQQLAEAAPGLAEVD